MDTGEKDIAAMEYDANLDTSKKIYRWKFYWILQKDIQIGNNVNNPNSSRFYDLEKEINLYLSFFYNILHYSHTLDLNYLIIEFYRI